MGQSNANPFAAYELAQKLVECIEPYLEGTTSGLPDRRCVTVGAIAWDNCECGQLAVSVQGGFETGTFPAVGAGVDTPTRRQCGPRLFVFDFLVSMTRCAPIGDDEGNPPPCDALSAAARIAVEDAWAVRAGVVCCLADAAKTRLENGTTEIVDFTIGTQLFVGPDGLCQGSELPVSIAIMNGCYPCDVS